MSIWTVATQYGIDTVYGIFLVHCVYGTQMRFQSSNPTPASKRIRVRRFSSLQNVANNEINTSTYTTTMGKVTVYLDKLTNLKDADGFGKSDPYVKFHLEKDNWGPMDVNYGERKSTMKANTLNPEYGETFVFNGVPSLDKLVLHIRIMDEDIGRDDKLGKCTVKLFELGNLSNFVNVEETIDRKLFGGEKAKIYLKIKYDE